MLVICPNSKEIKLRCEGKLAYHCLKNKEGQLLEKCIRPLWIQKGFCAELNSDGEINPGKCNESIGICPTVTYMSTDTMKYSACSENTQTFYTTEYPSGYVGHTLRALNLSIISEANNGTGPDAVQIAVPLLITIFIAIAICFIVYKRNILRKKFCPSGYQFVPTKDNTQGDQPEFCPSGYQFVPTKDNTQGDQPDDPVTAICNIDSTEDNISHPDQCGLTAGLQFFPNEAFFETRASKELSDHIRQLNSVVITGMQGSGKTSLAWNTSRKLVNEGESVENRYVLYAVQDLDQLPSKLDDNKINILLLDDIFEDSHYPETAIVSLLERLKRIKDYYKGKSVIYLVIISNYVFAEIQRHLNGDNFFDSMKTIDLSSSEYALTLADKTGILVMHGFKLQDPSNRPWKYEKPFSVSASVFSSILYEKQTGDMKIGFPLAAAQFCREELYFNEESYFFKDPVGRMRWILENPVCYISPHIGSVTYRLRYMYRVKLDFSKWKNMYATAMYAMLKGGILDSDNVDVRLLSTVGTICRIRDPKISVSNAFFYHKHRGLYEFYHTCIMQLIFTMFGEQYSKYTMQLCTVNRLFQFITLKTDDKATNEEYKKTALLY